jgi:hypothetical protein
MDAGSLPVLRQAPSEQISYNVKQNHNFIALHTYMYLPLSCVKAGRGNQI